MGKFSKTAVTPLREDNFSEWYQQVIKVSDIAENSDVRGCMIIKPWGYGIWENIQSQLDYYIKKTGHKNVYFPMLIPMDYFEKEAEHVEGFATECAVVTHHRLEMKDGKMTPSSKLKEPYVIRPTSEMIIGSSFSRWVQSYKDLPLLINQWANVMRWEMRPRLFLRTSEFLWQEGHTVHATEEEAIKEAKLMHEVYKDFLKNHLAIPVISGEKTENERFPGAVNTFTIEAIVQDKKAIQAGTSHFLGQKFSKASNISFENNKGKRELTWTTSWGVSTRLVGTLIMMHSDDNGLVLPPRISPIQVIIIPIIPKEDQKNEIIEYAQKLLNEIQDNLIFGKNVSVEIDTRDLGFGVKGWDWIKKGVPIRIEVGPKDLENDSVVLKNRNRDPNDKSFVKREDVVSKVLSTLESIQEELFNKALKFQKDNIKEINDMKEFEEFFTPKNSQIPEIHGGAALVHWNGTNEQEEEISKKYKVSIRCIPDDETLRGGEGICIYTKRKSKGRVIFAKSY